MSADPSESSPTMSYPVVEDPVSPTDIIGACASFVIASLGVGGVPEALGLTPGQVATIVGLLGTLVATVRHFARLRAAKKAVP